MYDPELPAGFQDADFEMRSLESEARRVESLRKRGICCHTWIMQRAGDFTCYHCGGTFPGNRFEMSEYDHRDED